MPDRHNRSPNWQPASCQSVDGARGGKTLHHRVGYFCWRRLALGKGVHGKILQRAWAEAVGRIWLHVGVTAELQATHDFATCHGPYTQTTTYSLLLLHAKLSPPHMLDSLKNVGPKHTGV
jgi:hypothetical protein